jgi:hypothetical protein
MNEEVYEYIFKVMETRKGNQRENLLPQLINHLNLKLGVEIGVDLAENSKIILDRTTENFKFLLVDNYMDDYRNKKKYDGGLRYKIAQDNLTKYLNNRCQFLIGDSFEVSKGIEDNTVDIIYIDGDHSYNGIKRDFEAWMPKVRVGGIVSGHDYKNKLRCGVKRFVDEYALENGLRIITLGGRGRGFLFIK